MKVSNWCRKLAASLVAGGLILPVATNAADLDTNLVVDPGFEDINNNTCCFAALELNSWMDGTQTGFTYASGVYDNGGPLAGGGARYFTSNGEGSGTDINAPGIVAQNIDVSAGATAGLIAAGEAAVNIRAFFSSYLGDGDFGTLHVDFLDGSSSSLGTAQVSDGDTSTWTQHSTGGFVPVGTDTLRVSVFGTPLAGGPDGYIDNVDVQITSVENILLFLEVDTTTGATTIRNNTGEAVSIDYYELMSDSGNGSSLLPDDANWTSLQDQDLTGFPAGNGSGNGWEEAGGSGPGVLSESYLTGNSQVASGASIPIGTAFDTSSAQDLTFRYGNVAGSTDALQTDYNGDGEVNAADYTISRDTLGSTTDLRADGDGSGTIDPPDYTLWKGDYGMTGGPSGPGVLTTGFVRYVTPASAQAAGVPEPSSVLLVSVGLAGLWAVGGQRPSRLA